MKIVEKNEGCLLMNKWDNHDLQGFLESVHEVCVGSIEATAGLLQSSVSYLLSLCSILLRLM
jgi:hypothetical protein